MRKCIAVSIFAVSILLSACSSPAPAAAESPTLTATSAIPTATSTPLPPAIILEAQAQCFNTPEEGGQVVGTLPAGQPIPVVGKDDYGQYWVVIDPASQKGCWVPRAGTTAQGLTDYLPNLVPPPTPRAQRPAAPGNLAAKLESCGRSAGTANVEWDAAVIVTWEDNSSNEDSFRVYKDDFLIENTGSNAAEYRDVFKVTGNGSVHARYVVEAYSIATGESERVETKIDFVCK